MKHVELVEPKYLKKDLPQFKSGDTVRVHVKIKEEDKVRIQVFEGVVMRKRGRGINAGFTVRKVSYGEGVERVFLTHSPMIDKIQVIRKGKVRRAKLYYLRGKKGKQSKIEQKLEKA